MFEPTEAKKQVQELYEKMLEEGHENGVFSGDYDKNNILYKQYLKI
jgi:hypothetical protein